jgi:hypothetical protein
MRSASVADPAARQPRSRAAVAVALLGLLLAGSGGACGRRDGGDVVNVAPGVTFRRDREAGVQLLDIDLIAAKVRPVVVAEHVERIRNNFVGDARTVWEWADARDAVGGINAGFFGDTYDQLGRRKQIVGLAAVNGRVIAPADFTTSTAREGERFLRSAIGFHADGTPEIAWAKGGLRGPLRRFDAPVNPRGADIWDVRSAVSCGPRLFAAGARRISDRDERLVSPGKLPRAFVAYDREQGRPRHLILGRADAMEYTDVALFLSDYFARAHSSTPREAMCLDGGPSAQIVYRRDGRLEDAEPTGVLVPTAILLVPAK